MKSYLLTIIVFCLSGYTAYAQYDDLRIIENPPIHFPDSITRNENGKIITKKNKNGICEYLSSYPVEAVWEEARLVRYIDEASYLKLFMGMSVRGLYYNVYRENDTIRIDSEESLRKYFTPITDEMMALAYVYILHEYKPMHDFSFLTQSIVAYKKHEIENRENRERIAADESYEGFGYIYTYEGCLPDVSELETSYIKRVEGGYEMLLYHFYGDDCTFSSPYGHYDYYTAHKIFLKENGELKTLSTNRVISCFSLVHCD